jgi:hypothetical protein
MERGDRGDQVERARLEGRDEKVPEQVADVAGPGMGAGQLDAPLVPVDAGDVWYPVPQAPGERALAAADVERPLAAGRDGVEDHPVVVAVVVPRLWRKGWPRRAVHDIWVCPAGDVL